MWYFSGLWARVTQVPWERLLSKYPQYPGMILVDWKMSKENYRNLYRYEEMACFWSSMFFDKSWLSYWSAQQPKSKFRTKWATSYKTNKMTVRPAKTQISLGISPDWSESLLCTHWVAKDPSSLYADSEDSDQTGRMPRLIWVFAGHLCHFIGFVMRRPTCIVWLTWQSHFDFNSVIWLICCSKDLDWSSLSNYVKTEWPESAQKPSKWPVRPEKTQVSLGICTVRSESSLCTLWEDKDTSFLEGDSETEMPRLIRVFTRHIYHFVCFVVLLLKYPYKEFYETFHRQKTEKLNVHKIFILFFL